MKIHFSRIEDLRFEDILGLKQNAKRRHHGPDHETCHVLSEYHSYIFLYIYV